MVYKRQNVLPFFYFYKCRLQKQNVVKHGLSCLIDHILIYVQLLRVQWLALCQLFQARKRISQNIEYVNLWHTLMILR